MDERRLESVSWRGEEEDGFVEVGGRRTCLGLDV